MDDRGELCEGIEETVDDELTITTAQHLERATYEASYEPWPGNEGGEAEKWYRQAVLVVMPKSSELYEEVSASLEAEPGVDDEPAAPRIVRRAKGRRDRRS